MFSGEIGFAVVAKGHEGTGFLKTGSASAAFFLNEQPAHGIPLPRLSAITADNGRRNVRLVLELFLCARHDKDAVNFHHCQTDITGSHADPDTIMQVELGRLGLVNGHSARFAHSTSWRYEEGRTLLTYLVWVDAGVLQGLRTSRLSLVPTDTPRSSGPLAPRPDTLCKNDVLMHALRHLRYLVVEKKDARIAETVGGRATCDLLFRLKPALAGRIPASPGREPDLLMVQS
jgi:hypothetical protein